MFGIKASKEAPKLLLEARSAEAENVPHAQHIENLNSHVERKHNHRKVATELANQHKVGQTLELDFNPIKSTKELKSFNPNAAKVLVSLGLKPDDKTTRIAISKSNPQRVFVTSMDKLNNPLKNLVDDKFKGPGFFAKLFEGGNVLNKNDRKKIKNIILDKAEDKELLAQHILNNEGALEVMLDIPPKGKPTADVLESFVINNASKSLEKLEDPNSKYTQALTQLLSLNSYDKELINKNQNFVQKIFGITEPEPKSSLELIENEVKNAFKNEAKKDPEIYECIEVMFKQLNNITQKINDSKSQAEIKKILAPSKKLFQNIHFADNKSKNKEISPIHNRYESFITAHNQALIGDADNKILIVRKAIKDPSQIKGSSSALINPISSLKHKDQLRLETILSMDPNIKLNKTKDNDFGLLLAVINSIDADSSQRAKPNPDQYRAELGNNIAQYATTLINAKHGTTVSCPWIDSLQFKQDPQPAQQTAIEQ